MGVIVFWWLAGWGVPLVPFRTFVAGQRVSVFAAGTAVRVFVAPPPK